MKGAPIAFFLPLLPRPPYCWMHLWVHSAVKAQAVARSSVMWPWQGSGRKTQEGMRKVQPKGPTFPTSPQATEGNTGSFASLPCLLSFAKRDGGTAGKGPCVFLPSCPDRKENTEPFSSSQCFLAFVGRHWGKNIHKVLPLYPPFLCICTVQGLGRRIPPLPPAARGKCLCPWDGAMRGRIERA